MGALLPAAAVAPGEAARPSPVEDDAHNSGQALRLSRRRIAGTRSVRNSVEARHLARFPLRPGTPFAEIGR
jgi:hypothetical protein